VRRAIVVATLLVLGLNAAPVSGQSREWAVDYAHEHAATSTDDLPGAWITDRLQTIWRRVEDGGWLAGVERQERYGVADIAWFTRAYRRNGDWTYAADVTGTPHAHFLREIAAGGEISYRFVGNAVASGAYHYGRFPSTVVHQTEPALTWYHSKGETQARVFVTRDVTHEFTFAALLLRTLYDVTPRVQLGGGLAIGEGIFFLEPDATGPKAGTQFYGATRLGFTGRDFIEIVVTIAAEDPAFTYNSLGVGYKRMF
jgi:YaiO family outer membrane protein